MFSIFRLLCCLACLSLVGHCVGQDVYISELMYDPRSNEDHLEYLELHNAGTTAVTLDQWTITGTLVSSHEKVLK
jgi:hypothetical protein